MRPRISLDEALSRVRSVLQQFPDAARVEVQLRDGTVIQLPGYLAFGSSADTVVDRRDTVVDKQPLHLSQTESAILAVATSFYQTAEELCRLSNVPYSTETKPVIRNMVERGLLESCSGKGYRLSG